MSIISSLANNFSSTGKLKSSGFNNASLANVTALDSSIALGNLILISTQTASASSSISFTSGIDSTYDEYIFKFINIHPSTHSVHLQFNLSTDGGSNYNVSKTTTHWRAYHSEDDSGYAVGYRALEDLTSSTSDQILVLEIGNADDCNSVGYFHLFAPSSTTYVKHFLARGLVDQTNTTCRETYTAGYGNTTSAINAVRFQMSSGNIDDGIIKMYGVKKS